jgi:MerR family transcriptional regulator, light-induced transcriptional regulator
MQQTQQTPTFNMKAVIHETGLKPDTLRAWERRYGLPAPERTSGGHRLYSQRDIDTLKWLIGRQEEGLSISHAVELWNRLVAQGQDPLLVATPAAKPADMAPAVPGISGANVERLRREWIESCLAFDERSAERVLAQGFSLYSPEQVCFEILQKGLAELGEGWYRGETTVQQEHFASELASRRLELLVAATPPPTRSGRVLAGCPPGEEHTFVPLLLTLILRRQGWDVLYLGPNVPVDRLEATISSTRPQLAIFPAQQLTTAASLIDIAEVLGKERVPMAYGGRVFNVAPDLRERITGHYLGEQLDTAGQVVEKILTTPQALTSARSASMVYQEGLYHFGERRAAVESSIWRELSQLDVPYAELVEANTQLAAKISAALKLGDMNYMASEMSWVEGLVKNHEINGDSLGRYLDAYRRAVENEMDERGQPVKEWFSRLNR